MAVFKNYKVEYYTGSGYTDITDKIVSLDDFSWEDNGILSTAKITIDAQHGDFMTNSNGGATPILKNFDIIKITIIDDVGVSVHDKKFEITTDLSQLSKTTQYFLPLELEARERNLKGVPFSGFFRSPPVNFHDMIEKIVIAYDNGSEPTIQPIATTTFASTDQNEAPKFNPNIWDFTQVDNCYDALIFVLNQLNLPVSAGGGGGRYALKFIDDPFVEGNIIVRVLKQGNNNPGSIPTLQQNVNYPIMKIDKVKLPSSGTQVIARGRPKTGHLYTELDKFVGRLEFYRAIPFYNSAVVYETDTYVRVGTQRYKAIQQVPVSTPPPNVTYWTAIDVGDYVGNIDYSPLTKNKLNEWLNGWGNPEGGFGIANFNTVAIPDANIEIHDRDPSDVTLGTNRILVLFRSNTDDISADLNLKKYRYGVTSANYVEGTQILVDTSIGALGGFFAANNYGNGAGVDMNGKSYANAVVRYTEYTNISGLGYDWFVVREPESFDQVAVWNERKNYEYNWAFASQSKTYPGEDRRRGAASGSNAWRPIYNEFMGNDCWHAPISVTQVDGLYHDSIEDDEPLNDPGGTPYRQNSALKIEFGYNANGLSGPFEDVWKKIYHLILTTAGVSGMLATIAAAIFNRYISPDYTTMGWWISIPSPHPLSTHNSVSQIGSTYGGDSNDINAHRYFDLFNSTRTVTGKIGYNQADSDTIGEITGFEMLLNFDVTAAGNRVGFTGNLPFAHWALDKDGQLWKSPKKFLRKLGETDKLVFEYGDLSPVFYPRTPLGIDNLLENILVPEIQKNKVIQKENIILQGVQLEIPYDQHGRYAPNLFEQVVKPVFYNFFGGGSDDIRFIGIVDAFNWIKTPTAISNFDSGTKRIITPEFKDHPNIVNIQQLQRYADAQEQVETFPYEQYTVVQAGIGDLEVEDSVYLSDAQMINDADNGPNTRLLAVRSLHYSVPRDKGLLRKVVLVKVIS